MSKLPQPDDVDFFVGGVVPDPAASIETVRFIEEYKKRPEFAAEAEEAERILASLGINARAHGMEDAKALLEHWHRCVADLRKADHGETNGKRVEQVNTGVGSNLPRDAQS